MIVRSAGPCNSEPVRSRSGGVTRRAAGAFEQGMKTALPCFLLLLAAGCGGGDSRYQNNNTVDTGSARGALLGVEVRPVAGSYAIATDAVFEISWPTGTPAPPSFSVTLTRYQEGYSYDGYDSSGSSTSTTVNPVHDTQLALVQATSELGRPVWQVVPKYKLAKGGIYYLTLKSGDEEWRAVFRVEGTRLVRV